MAGVVDGAVTGVRVVKGFGQEEQEIERARGRQHARSTPPGCARSG